MKTLIILLSFLFNASALACIKPEGAQIELSGEVNIEVFPGRPNYESIDKGDEAEAVWILSIDSPVCVTGLKQKQGRFHLFWLGTEKHISNPGRYRISGKTIEAHTGHHHTPVLIEVETAVKL